MFKIDSSKLKVKVNKIKIPKVHMPKMSKIPKLGKAPKLTKPEKINMGKLNLKTGYTLKTMKKDLHL